MAIFATAMEKYRHIINLPHWDPVKHERMPLDKRAAQFASFAALSGHDEAISETARLTVSHPDPEVCDAKAVNAKLAWLLSHAQEAPTAVFTYFKPDDLKEGGAIIQRSGVAKRLDDETKAIALSDGASIPLSDIISIESESFNDLEEFWD